MSKEKQFIAEIVPLLGYIAAITPGNRVAEVEYFIARGKALLEEREDISAILRRARALGMLRGALIGLKYSVDGAIRTEIERILAETESSGV